MVWLLKQPFSRFGHFKIRERHNLGMVGVVRTVTARPPRVAHMAASRAVTPCRHAGSVEQPGLGRSRLQRAAGPAPYCPASRCRHWCRRGRAALPSPRRRIRSSPMAPHRCLPCRWPCRCYERARCIHGIGYMAVPAVVSPIKVRQSLVPCRSRTRARFVRCACACAS